jgi:hypothetical protein
MRVVFLLAVVCICCSPPAENKSSGKLNGLHKYYYPDGGLYLEINFKDSIPHGLSKQYFKNGKVFEETNYVNGVRHGVSKTFYESGILSSETPYDSGHIHGMKKKYRKDGQLSFEAPYYFDNPCVGLKEYYLSGRAVDNYPSIVVRPEDNLLRDNMYILNISLSDGSNLVEFYKGTLTDGKYIGKDAQSIPTSKGVGRLYYVLPPGGFVMEKLDLLAKVKTELNNYYITRLQYNLAAENR